jgi:hypothetical protein
MIKLHILVFLLILIVCSCKKPYNPPLKNIPATGFLVVEGSVNSGSDSTFIKLSRSVSLASKIVANPELNATVTVQNDQNLSYPLMAIGNGFYACAGLNLDNSRMYRLYIKTANNEQYASDFATILNSPPIDSISYDFNGNNTGPGANVYANTHDPTGTVKYYRWDYQETWEFQSAFQSAFISNGDSVVLRNQITDQIFRCWRSDTSSNIILGSSAKLSQGVIFNTPLTFIPSADERVGFDYSILVRQYALTADAYNFYGNIKKNSEQLGSIFDAEPSEISGNIHCITNPAEPVIGYLSIGNVTSQRIFIKKQQVPNGWTTIIPYYAGCQLSNDPLYFDGCCSFIAHTPNGAVYNQVDAYINYDIGHYPFPLIPIDAIGMPGHPPTGYTAATKECTDCTLRGTNVEPSYWQ